MKRASKRTGRRLYQRPGFLKFIFCCMYSLSFKFFRLRVVSRALRSFFLALLLLLSLSFISFSRYLWKPSVFASSGPLHLRFVVPVSSSYLCREISEDAYLGQASSNIARCRTFIEPVDSSGFSPETWGRSYCPHYQPIKTSRKLNIMRQILAIRLPTSSFETFKIYYLISNVSLP